MNNFVGEIERLLKERDGCLRRVEQIEDQLERVRLALGIRTNGRATPSPSKARGNNTLGQTKQDIIAALSIRQPQSVSMLTERVGTTTVGPTCTLLVAEGRIVRRRRDGKTFWYALDEKAFGQWGEGIERVVADEREEASAEPG